MENKQSQNKVFILILIMLFVGFNYALSNVTQSVLKIYTGSWEASFLSFVLSLIACFIIAVILRKGSFKEIKNVKPWQVIGGCFGAISLLMVVTVTSTLGAATMSICRLSGTVMFTMLIDHFGLLGMPKMKFNGIRLIGTLFILAGIVCVSGIIKL